MTLASGATLGADVRAAGEARAADDPWSLSFPPRWGAPAKVGLDGLT